MDQYQNMNNQQAQGQGFNQPPQNYQMQQQGFNQPPQQPQFQQAPPQGFNQPSQGFNQPPQQGYVPPSEQQPLNTPQNSNQQQGVTVEQTNVVIAVQGQAIPGDLTQPAVLKCNACNVTTTTRIQADVPAGFACLWCLGFGLIGCLSYMVCCKKAHEYKHFCGSCGNLITTKQGECCSNCE